MNIYFACSITGGREMESVYQAIVHLLLKEGHIVPTAHLANPGVNQYEQTIGASEIYERDTNWIRDCDLLIAEVTTPSHGVGYEVAYALEQRKPVLCIYRLDVPISKMLAGNPDGRLHVRGYQDMQEAINIIKEFIDRNLDCEDSHD